MSRTEHRDQSKVSKVVLYSDRGLVTRTLTRTFELGSHKVIVEDLPDSLHEDSFRVTAKGTAKVTILDVKVSREYHEKVAETVVHDLLKKIEEQVDYGKRIQDQLDIIASQREFLDAAQRFSAESISREIELRPPSVEDWQKMLDFQGSSRKALNDQSYTLLEDQRRNQESIRKLKADLKLLQGAAKKWRKSGIIELDVHEKGDLEFSLSYQIFSATWHPHYEARVDMETKNVKLGYYGMVEQRTGENWEGVSLELSTARPHLDGDPPKLHPWYMRPWAPPPAAPRRSASAKGGGNRGRKMKKMAKMDMGEMEDEGAIMMSAPAPAGQPAAERQASVQSGPGATVQFLVPGTSDVPGDGSISKHKLMEEEFPCEFHYLTIPKMVELVYLNASFENKSDYPLLPGKMHIFRDGGFVGTASIPHLIASDEKFNINLGVDESIRVKRKLLRRVAGEKGIFSKNRRMEYVFQITIENMRKSDEDIIVRDQLPISQEEKIKVEISKIAPAENPDKNKDKLPVGTVEWKVHVFAGSNESCELAFSIEYPHDLRVEGLQ